MTSVRELLLDAKKAVAAAVAGAGTAAAVGLLSGQLAGEITAAGAVATTVLVYLLGNVAPAGDDTGPGTTGVDADLEPAGTVEIDDLPLRAGIIDPAAPAESGPVGA